MQLNTELFQKIHEVLELNPSKLDMNSWENRDSVCGATRCIAGWAIHLTTGQPLYDYDSDAYHYLHASIFELAEQLGVRGHPIIFEALAMRLLGLDGDTARNLFHGKTVYAVEFVRLVAEGEGEAAIEFMDEAARAYTFFE